MDISTRSDVERLITRFYEKVKTDPVIGFIFTTVMKVNWEAHLPVMFDFWESILLDTNKYNRNAMGVHFDVNREVRLEAAHFKRWMELFEQTVDELFEGDVATNAKKRAKSIADVMLFKMEQENKNRPA